MHVSHSRRRQLFRGDSPSALGRDSCICQWLFLQFKPNETELHSQYQNGFFVQVLGPVSPSRQQSSLSGLQALHTLINKTPGHSWKPTLILLWMSLINVWGGKARPISQISLKIVLMVPIWTLSNPLQCLTFPTKSGGGGGSGVGDGISWLISVDYLCQQWFRKLIVCYLQQYQTFLVKTARSQYTMPSYD